MEGRDILFGDMLESVSQKVESEDKKTNETSYRCVRCGSGNTAVHGGEIKCLDCGHVETEKPGETLNIPPRESKDGKAQDPLKTKSPKELKGDGKKDMKLQKMGESEKTEEGKDPYSDSDKKGDYGQDEKSKIDKLTEGEDVAQDVKALIAKAKEALDSGNYDEAQNLVSRLSQVKAAVSEPEEIEPGNTGMGMPAVDVEEEVEENKEVSEEDPSENPTEDDVHEKFIMDDKLQEMIDRALDAGIEKIDEAGKKKDPKAKLRNRGDVVFPAESPKVTDDKDHFPINNKNQARNALARANQYSSSPKWYKGKLTDLVKKVANAVKRKYKDIDVSKAAEKPGKG